MSDDINDSQYKKNRSYTNYNIYEAIQYTYYD